MWMLTPVSCLQYTACRSYYVKRHGTIPSFRNTGFRLQITWSHPRCEWTLTCLAEREQRDKQEVFVWKGLRVITLAHLLNNKIFLLVSFMIAACPPDPANLFFSHTFQQTLSKSGTVSLLLCGSSLGLVASSVSVGALRQCSDEMISASGRLSQEVRSGRGSALRFSLELAEVFLLPGFVSESYTLNLRLIRTVSQRLRLSLSCRI